MSREGFLTRLLALPLLRRLHKAFLNRSKPKAACLRATKSKLRRDLPNRRALREQFGRLVKQGRFDVPRDPANGGLVQFFEEVLKAGFKWQGRFPGQCPGLFNMDFEPRSLTGRIIGRAAQCYDRIERVFAATRSSLFSVHTGMVNYQDGNALTPKPEQPILQREQRIA